MALVRPLAALAALVIWASLALQFGLTVDRMTADGATVPAAVWRYVGFFSILTNAAAAVVATAMAVNPVGPLAGPRLRLSVATAMVMVGVVFALMLRPTSDATGWQLIANDLLHNVTRPCSCSLGS